MIFYMQQAILHATSYPPLNRHIRVLRAVKALIILQPLMVIDDGGIERRAI
jgi:hypothetical protein